MIGRDWIWITPKASDGQENKSEGRLIDFHNLGAVEFSF